MLQKYLFSDLLKDERVRFREGLFWLHNKLLGKAIAISCHKRLTLLESVYLFVFSALFSKLYFSKGKIYCFTNNALLGMSPLFFKLFFTIHFWKTPCILFIDSTEKKFGINAYRCSRLIKHKNCYSSEPRDINSYGYKNIFSGWSMHPIEKNQLNMILFLSVMRRAGCKLLKWLMM